LQGADGGHRQYWSLQHRTYQSPVVAFPTDTSNFTKIASRAKQAISDTKRCVCELRQAITKAI
jgi:hypothetical protein